MSEPQSPTAHIGTFPPVIATLLADSVGVRHLNESIARSVAAAVAPFAEMHAKLGAQIGADLLASLAPLNAQTSADIAAMCARAFPAVEPIPEELLTAVRRPPMAALSVRVDRVTEAVNRNTTMTVSTITTSLAPITADVGRIARPRFQRLRLGLQIVGGFVLIVGAAEGLDQIVRVVQSIIH
jgi:hypothetical protein